MKLKDCYRGENMFELFRFIVSECAEVNAYGVFLFLVDNDYEVRRFTCDELEPREQLAPDILDEMERNDAQHKARWDKGEVPIEPLT